MNTIRQETEFKSNSEWCLFIKKVSIHFNEYPLTNFSNFCIRQHKLDMTVCLLFIWYRSEIMYGHLKGE